MTAVGKAESLATVSNGGELLRALILTLRQQLHAELQLFVDLVFVGQQREHKQDVGPRLPADRDFECYVKPPERELDQRLLLLAAFVPHLREREAIEERSNTF